MVENINTDKNLKKNRKKHVIIEETENEKVWSPANWKDQWSNLLKMRDSFDAPVDIMGCERLADKSEKPPNFRYQVLLSLMLSSQTKDEITSAAMTRLKEHGCTIDKILETEVATLENLIYPVGFYKTKAKFILRTTAILKEDYDKDIPKSVKELCKLPGVGPKMAHLVMKCAWDQVTGIAVDSHVHKICNRLGWTKKVTKSPIETQSEIESWIPKDLWSDVNYIMVGFGQQTCHTKNPKCSSCLNSINCLFKLGLRK